MLVLSDAITLDLSFRETYLVPLIVIDSARDETGNFINEPMYISTNKGVFSGDVFWEDFDLKISSIKESLDLVNRKYKINNLSFTLSNYYVQDKRISDFVADRALLNKTVEVYYKTQSCKTLEDCVLIFKGDIRRFDHDSKLVRVELEDLTEGKLSKELPIANTGFGGNLYNKEHKNQPIPMVYGSVEKSPTIPFINLQAQNDETDINLICDDVLNSDRGIKMGGFFGDDIASSFTTESCPLYIYKDSYFLVLQTYVPEAAYEQGEGNFFYDDYEQYTVQEDSIQIKKKFNRNRGLNPPAMNELQAVTRRYPNSMKLLEDPSLGDQDSDSWLDAMDYGVHFLNSTVKSPELAFDNADATLLSPELIFASNLSSSYRETYAEIPDTLQQITLNDDVVHSFKPYGSLWGHPSYHSHFANSDRDNYQYQIMNWFHRYAHSFNNNYAEPTVTYIRMPKVETIIRAMGKHFWERVFSGAHYDIPFGGGDSVALKASVNNEWVYYELPYYNIGEVPISSYGYWLKSNTTRVNTHPNMNPNYASDWAESSSLSTQPIDDIIDGGGNILDLFAGDALDDEYGFRHICETVGGNWQRTNGQQVKYPQGLYYQIEVVDTYMVTCPTYNEEGTFIGNTTIDLKWESINRYKDGASASLYNDSMGNSNHVMYDIDGNNMGQKVHFNLFDIGTFDPDDMDSFPVLFNANDFPQYSPIQRTGGETGTYGSGGGAYPDGMRVEYLSLWNGVSIDSAPDSGSGLTPSWNIPPSNYGYFGGRYGTVRNVDSDAFVSERDVCDISFGSSYATEHVNDSGWALWIREDVHADVGTIRSPNRPDEYNLDEPANVYIKANTLMPIQHYSKPKPQNDDLSGTKGYNFANHGTIIPVDFGQLQLYSEGASEGTSIRLGCVFTFKDLEVSDNVKCDTFFEGKIKNRFTEDTVSDASKHFVLGCGAIDIDEDEEFNWATFDSAFDSDNVPLINIALSECYNSEQSMIEFDSYQHPESMQDGHTNQFSGTLTDYNIPEFWTPNNYNALTMMYRVDKGGSDSSIAALSTEIYNISMVQYIIFGAALDSNIYANVNGRVNTMDDTVDTDDGLVFKYTGMPVTPIGDFVGDNPQEEYDNQTSAISSPFSVIYHMLEKEAEIEDPIETSIDQTIGASDMSLSFSITEKIKAKELINNLCTNTNIFPMFKSTSKFSFTAIKTSYNSSDVHAIILSDEIVKSKFTRTPLQKVYTLVNVKYHKDYETGDYLRDTGYIDGYDCYGNGDLTFRIDAGETGYSYDYLAVDREANVLDFEAEFIRNQGDAETLRDFMYMYNCNQHNIFKLTLPLKYLYLEVGDVVRFDKLIENTLAYGEDYTADNVTRNAQTIYPFFIIDSIDKKQKSITIQVTQLHNLQKTFQPEIGSVSRSFGVGEVVGYNESDSTILENYLLGGEMYFTNEQKRVSDWNLDGYIDNGDLQQINYAILSGGSGDINLDGMVNVVDIIEMVNIIVGGSEPTDEQLAYGDTNGDGLINVTDIIATVNQIIGGGDE